MLYETGPILSFSDSDPRMLLNSSYKAGLDRPWGFQEVEAPTFPDNRWLSLSALCTGRLNSPAQEIFVVLISFRGWVDRMAIMRPEGIIQWKIPTT
jgi:hypothetical protein